MTKAELYGLVDKLRFFLGVNRYDYPINMFALCKRIKGIEVGQADFKTDDLRGMLYVPSSANENIVILVNGNKSFAEQNYHCAHEFLHLFDDNPKSGTIIKCYDTVKPNQNRYTEWVANEGAAEFLAPYKEFIPSFLSYYDMYVNRFSLWMISYGLRTVSSVLSTRFSISETVVNHRIQNLSYEIDQYNELKSFDNISLISKKNAE